MRRDRLRLVALAVLAVVAIGAAAATIDSAVETGGSGERNGFPGSSAETGFAFGTSGDGFGISGLFGIGHCSGWLTSPAFLGAVALCLGGLWAYGYYREGPIPASAMVVALLFPGGMLYFLMYRVCHPRNLDPRAPLPGMNMSNETGIGAGGASGSVGETIVEPSVVVAAVVALVVLVGIGLLRATGDDDADDDPVPSDEDEDVDLSAVGRAAGDAADRIEREGTTVDNEVYRAWTEMVGHLDVADPGTSTPGEFADAATEAGMDRRHVETLTGLFREVRYGDRPVTDERTDRATEALRRIEDAYAGGGDGP